MDSHKKECAAYGPVSSTQAQYEVMSTEGKERHSRQKIIGRNVSGSAILRLRTFECSRVRSRVCSRVRSHERSHE